MLDFKAATNALHGLYLAQGPRPILSVGSFATHPLSDAPLYSLERRYASLAQEVGEVESVDFHSGRKPSKDPMGYVFDALDPSTDREVKAAAKQKTVFLPRTVDQDRQTGEELHVKLERPANMNKGGGHAARRTIGQPVELGAESA